MRIMSRPFDLFLSCKWFVPSFLSASGRDAGALSKWHAILGIWPRQYLPFHCGRRPRSQGTTGCRRGPQMKSPSILWTWLQSIYFDHGIMDRELICRKIDLETLVDSKIDVRNMLTIRQPSTWGEQWSSKLEIVKTNCSFSSFPRSL